MGIKAYQFTSNLQTTIVAAAVYVAGTFFQHSAPLPPTVYDNLQHYKETVIGTIM